uniref:Uncharacterized protein n=1 Tax=viral metagenome TaxID=1070528 RepID=A0A6M3KZD9_9ZZZZ
MSWTLPVTWVAGTVVTAADMNSAVRDNLRFIKGLDGTVVLDDGLNLGANELTINSLETVGVDGIVNKEQMEDHTHADAANCGTVAHSALTGLTTGDDHTQYQKESLLTTAGDMPYATGASAWARLAKGGALQYLRMNAGDTAPEWAAFTVGTATVVGKSSDETVNNSTVMQDDDDLVVAVGANEIWSIQLYIRTNTHADADIKIAWTIPVAGALYSDSTIRTAPAPATPAAEVDGTTSFVMAGATAVRATYIGYLYIGGENAGNVQLQWAQQNAEEQDTKVLAGSYVISHKIV